MRCFFVILFLCFYSIASGQYRVETLCDVEMNFTNSLPKAVVKLIVPKDVVRVIYTINHNPQTDTTTLRTKVIALLPDHLDWFEISRIAGRINFSEPSSPLFNLLHFNSLKKVRLYAKGKNKIYPLQIQQSLGPGIYDIDWQATLFHENHYLYFQKTIEGDTYAHVEAVAIIAE